MKKLMISVGALTLVLILFGCPQPQQPEPTPKPSSQPTTKANLASLVASEGSLSPAFSAGTTSYTVSVPWEVTSIYLEAKAADPEARVEFANENPMALAVGLNTAIITVAGSDDVTKIYTVAVTRCHSTALSTLSLKSGTGSTVDFTPGFSETSYQYAVSVHYKTDQVALTAIPKDSTALVVSPASMTVGLEIGENAIPIIVRAPDGSAETQYTVMVTRRCVGALAEVKNYDYHGQAYILSSLAISPDGEHLYASDQQLDSILHFTRNKSDGEITYVSSYTAPDVSKNTDIEISPDGLFLYSAGVGSGANHMYGRLCCYARDPATGTLTRTAVVSNVDFFSAFDLCLAPNGSKAYCATLIGIAEFDRNAGDGSLVYRATVSHKSATLNGRSIAVSPDSRSVYYMGDGFLHFKVDDVAGGLVFNAEMPNPGNSIRHGLALDAEGECIYYGKSSEGSLLTYSIDVATGVPALLDARAGYSGVPLISADGKNLYLLQGYDIVRSFARSAGNGLPSYGGSIACGSRGTLRHGVCAPEGAHVYACAGSGICLYERELD